MAGAGPTGEPPPAGAAPTPLVEQVHAAIVGYALDESQSQSLPSIFRAHGLGWEEAVGASMCRKAAAQISQSLSSRGETSYSFQYADGQLNLQRVHAVVRYLTKLVAKRAGLGSRAERHNPARQR